MPQDSSRSDSKSDSSIVAFNSKDVASASMAGILSSHGNAVYATTKHAVVGLAEWMAFTYAHRGIRTHLLAPLGVNTPMLNDTADSEWLKTAAGNVRASAIGVTYASRLASFAQK